ncbi:hypothetical protein [Daejeonella sp. H1SJ63]|jgi:hypothetical protein|uniref:hypothetical protein n=1 Tax=Daejeonella sp. H1SJ63 TaxID=3034145 RepID=UPI0023EB9868|nr:hypothetical protein [Daejeonella sp. H1SJ63]
MKNNSKVFVVLMILNTILVSCKHEIPELLNDTIPTVSASCSTDSVYFVNDIQPLLISNCAMSGCHDAITHKEGINLTAYVGVMREVRAGNAGESSLYKSMIRTDEDRMPPRPAQALSADMLTKVRNWINQGAVNNSCTSCDQTKFTYSAVIKPLIANKCQGCHNPGSLGGGIDLSTYTAVKASAQSGKLYGSVSWAAGFSKMPQGSKLPACELSQIKSWIDAGMLNN